MPTSISPAQTQYISPHDNAYWAQVRSRFILEPGHAYLNNASLGMPPKPVRDAVAQGFTLLSENPTGVKRALGSYIENELRPAMAQFLGAAPEEIALARNATEGMYHIVNGLDLKAGDRVVITSQEHPSALLPWQIRAAQQGIELKTVHIPSPLHSADDIVARISDALDDRTRVLFFCHVTRGGYLYPVKRLCAMARARGIITAVDGAQAVGMMDVNLHDLGCDLYANSLHKWFLGPSGTGFLYVRRDFQPMFATLYQLAEEAGSDARRYEIAGTYDLPVRAALGASLDFLHRIGIQNIEPRLRVLSDYLKQALLEVPRMRLLSALSPDISSPGSTIFEIEGLNPIPWVGAMMEEDKIHVDDHDKNGHQALRISTHYYNTTDEIDRFMDSLCKRIERAG